MWAVVADIPLQHCKDIGKMPLEEEQRFCSNYKGIALSLHANVYLSVAERGFQSASCIINKSEKGSVPYQTKETPNKSQIQ